MRTITPVMPLPSRASDVTVSLRWNSRMTKFGFNFIPYIEQFALLEHMHRQYLTGI